MFKKTLACSLFTVLLIAGSLIPGTCHARQSAIRHDAKLAVRVAALGLSGILQDIETVEERERLIRLFVHSARFFPDDSGYFYVCNMAGICIAHGFQPALEGRDLIDNRDSTGIYITRLMLEQVAKGGGFFEYLWERPGSSGEHPKLGYVMPIPGTDYFIGTGIYLPK